MKLFQPETFKVGRNLVLQPFAMRPCTGQSQTCTGWPFTGLRKAPLLGSGPPLQVSSCFCAQNSKCRRGMAVQRMYFGTDDCLVLPWLLACGFSPNHVSFAGQCSMWIARGSCFFSEDCLRLCKVRSELQFLNLPSSLPKGSKVTYRNNSIEMKRCTACEQQACSPFGTFQFKAIGNSFHAKTVVIVLFEP